eukprot:scaffold19869_cov136-Skeletonema_dohrnii-CCMP3373.AAC.2
MLDIDQPDEPLLPGEHAVPGCKQEGVGLLDGDTVGLLVGDADGLDEGDAVGLLEGEAVGLLDGDALDCAKSQECNEVVKVRSTDRTDPPDPDICDRIPRRYDKYC